VPLLTVFVDCVCATDCKYIQIIIDCYIAKTH